MRRALVLCDGASPSEAGVSTRLYDKTVRINPFPPRKTLNYQPTNVTHRIMADLDPRARDLLDLAAFVWAGDCEVKRSSDTDIFSDHWKRHLTFVVPCRNHDLWNARDVCGPLERMLGFLSGDSYAFHFVKPREHPEQTFITDASSNLPAFGGADSAALFSGGLDSLAGAVAEVRAGRRPLLISHRSRSTLDNLQTRLAGALREGLPTWHFPHVSLWLNQRGKRRAEYTQRTRTFMYMSLATAVAYQCGLDEVRFFENGVVTFNLPLLGQNIGSRLTRSTHPKFIAEFSEFAELVLGRRIALLNPLLMKTKGDVVRSLDENGVGHLIGGSVSCAHAWLQTRLKPQCGTCSQCVDRRFAIASQGLEEKDPAYAYAKNTFTDALDGGDEKACALGYVQLAMKIASMSDSGFFAEYPQLFDAFPYVARSNAEAAKQIYELFKRHSDQVLSVVRQFGKHWDSVVAGKLPDSCLVRMVGGGLHLPDRLAASVPVATSRSGEEVVGTDAATVVEEKPEAPDMAIEVVAPVEPSAMTMTDIRQELESLAPTDCTVLLTGEPGTGKGYWAREVHKLGGRKGEFVPVLCPTMSKDLFESELFGHRRGAFTGANESKDGFVEAAKDGTLFLDEIAELPPPVQAKLLYLLQEKTYRRVGETAERPAQCRIILATNRDLREMLVSGEFRRDLHSRIGVYSYALPPLRERKAEIPELIQPLCKELAPKRSRRISKEERIKLQNDPYDWPDNIRTLIGALDRAFRFTRTRNVTAADIVREAKRIAPSDEQKHTS